MVNNAAVSVFDSLEENDVISFAPRTELQPAAKIQRAAANPMQVVRLIIRKFFMANPSLPQPREAARPPSDKLRETGDRQARWLDNCARHRENPAGLRRLACMNIR